LARLKDDAGDEEALDLVGRTAGFAGALGDEFKGGHGGRRQKSERIR
jgi:hypothetical protein